MEKVLIAGISGGQGRLVATRLLRDHRIVGVDRSAWEGRPAEIKLTRLDLRKRAFEALLLRERPRAVVHMGFVRHFRGDPSTRHDVNIRGTKTLLDACVRAGVEQLVVLSSGYVYGAFAENPYYMDEEHPLGASRSYPEIRDIVEVDAMASAFLWREPQIRTAVLRPVSTLGRQVQSLIRDYITRRRVPLLLGFDPLMQFLHEEDLAEAVALALASEARGVFNVVGPGAVPISLAVRACGGSPIRVPEFLMRPVFDRLYRSGLLAWPAGVLDFLKYPLTLSGDRFVEATGFVPRHDLETTFEATRGNA